MRTRSAVLAALTALTLASPLAFAAPPTPQVTDPAGDATFTATAQSEAPGIPGANQAYADVLSVTWAPDRVKVGKKTKVVGFTVTTLLSAPPTPPAGTIIVFRMLSQVGGDAAQYLGPVWYSSQTGDATTPQSALRDNLTGTTRLTKIEMPKIEGSTMTWKVPLTALPKEFKKGSTVSNLYFEVREIEDFRGQKVPDGVPVLGGATGLAAGIIDNGTSTSSFKIG